MGWKRYAETHPYAFALALIAIIILVDAMASLFLRALLPTEGPGVNFTILVTETALALIAAVMLSRMRWWKAVGFVLPRRRADLRLFWLPLVPAISNLSYGFKTTETSQIALFLMIALLAGFVEEVFFRGLMLRPLARRGVWTGVMVTSLIFGMLHTLNVLAGGDPLGVVVQVGFALALGFMYAALVVRTAMIWPLVVTHVLTNFAGFVATGQLLPQPVTTRDAIESLVFIIAFTAYGILLLRRGQHAYFENQD